MLVCKTVTTILFFAMLLPARATQAGAQWDRSDRRDECTAEQVQGTWKLKVDRVAQGVTFNVLMSFTAGGVVVATGSLDKVESVSPVFGSWKQGKGNRVDVTIVFFLFDSLGKAVGTLKTNESFRLQGTNKMTGTGLSYTCDVAGENCGQSPVGIVDLAGTRVEAEGVKE